MNKLTRRSFLNRTSIAAGATLAFPYVGNVLGANDRIHIACIGVGGKGDSDSSNAARCGGTIYAICDVDENTLNKKAGQFPQAKKFSDYRKMLDQVGKDIDAVTAFYAEDAVLLPPNAPAIFGRDAISATMQEMFVAGLGIELEDLEIKVSGNLGYKAGRYRTRGEDGSLIDRGKYIEIWSKIDGNWVLHRDIWNSSRPPVAA